MCEVIFFDLDGVLVDACDWHYHALNEALVLTGNSVISREDHETKYNGLPTHIKLEMLGYKKDIEKINKIKQNLTLKIIEKHANIMQEKIELHKYLKSQGIKIACVTNSIRQTAEKMLEKTGQLDYMDLLVTNENVQRNKPSPDCYLLALKTLKANPQKSICVEDSETGYIAAKNSTIKYIWKVKNSQEVTLEGFKKFNENINTNGG